MGGYFVLGLFSGKISVKDYYLSKRHEWLLHPETKIKFERMLGII